MSGIPLTLYVHLPWCVRKCPYCDFNSHHAPDTLPEDDYFAALRADLDYAIALHDETRDIEAIFFGGGTPSLFSAKGFGQFLEHVRQRLQVADDAEITLEANPGTIEHGRFADYRSAGINRVSLGVQSFDDAALQRLGRIHDGDAARRAIDELHAAGLDNFNLDLIFGLPEQTTVKALDDIRQALAAKPRHISHYELTLEPNTLFAARPPAGLPDEDLQIEIATACGEELHAAGFEHYEISAWSRPGFASRHNMNYWQFGDYLGIGAGAHAKLTRQDGILREARQRHPERYLAAAGHATAIQEQRELDAADTVFEFMLNALRLRAGVTDGLFEARTGLAADHLDTGLARAEQQGWLTRRGASGWQATASGLTWLNDLQALFLPERSQSSSPPGQPVID
jgi:oxygen-independent coproporphyrinogen-3 oxidase